MWFKNLYFFKFEKSFELTAEHLHDELVTKKFNHCLPSQRTSLGWTPPLGKNTESLTHSVNNNILISMMREERILPATVIRDTLDEKVEVIEDREHRKVSSREKKELREEIENELLPRAFTRKVKLDAWIDKENGWLVVNTSSNARAEEFTKLLRKTLGSLPVSLIETETAPAVAMTHWVNSGTLPEPFELGYECVLKNQGDDKGSATYKQHDLTLDEVMTSLQSGKFVKKLAVIWDEKLSFIMTEDLKITRLKFLDVLEESLANEDPQSYEEHMDIQFALMVGEVSAMIADLTNALK